MRAEPRLSIGLPVYNGERYLGESLEAILGQDFGDFELIVSDNASSDRTAEIAREAAARDPRVTWSRSAINVGAAANFDRVFRRARAPLFKWACADDPLSAGFLGAAVRHLDAHPEAVACYGGVALIDAEGAALGDFEQGLDLREDSALERFRRATVRIGLLHVLQGVMRTAVLQRTGGYRAYPGSDEVLVAELALAGQIHELPAPMLLRRMHAQAQSASTSAAERLAHLDPGRSQSYAPHYWRHSLEHLRAVGRAPLGARMRLELTAHVLRRMIGSRDHLARELGDGLRHLTRFSAPRRG